MSINILRLNLVKSSGIYLTQLHLTWFNFKMRAYKCNVEKFFLYTSHVVNV